MGYNQYHNGDADASIFLMQFENAVWLPFQQFKVPVIELGTDTTVKLSARSLKRSTRAASP